jgi:dihydroorotate dehydrogenase
MEFAGVEFKNPFVVASSPLTANIKVLQEADRAALQGPGFASQQ